MSSQKHKLVVIDIDNTVFDWVRYYVTAISALFSKVEEVTGISQEVLASDARQVFTRYSSIEYPFLIQEMPSVLAFYNNNIDKMLEQAVEPGRKAFLDAAGSCLVPYPDVRDAFARYKKEFSGLPLVALTDAPRYVAMWKLNKLGILANFDAVYGLADPRIPTCDENNRVKVDPRILLKHLQQSNFGFGGKIRILPDEYEKPGTRGLKTVLMDYELEDDPALRRQVLWAGDNLKKDVGLGARLGVCTAWAQYGVVTDQDLYRRLHTFSPEQNIHKHASVDKGSAEAPRPDIVLQKFSDLLDHIVR